MQDLDLAIGWPSRTYAVPTLITPYLATATGFANGTNSIKSTNLVHYYSTETPSRLPSLLRYTDHDLMQNAALHNHPPHPTARCPICQNLWNASHTESTPPSTFLPLSPCNHWLHYRCLIQLACDPSSPFKDKCPICHTQLYTWDAITALTLATRTGLYMCDTNPHGGSNFTPGASDAAAYEAECAGIDALIRRAFFAQLAQPSQYADGSPDLVCAYQNVVWEAGRQGVPRAQWLQCRTKVGAMLFFMLILVKMRRFLVEGHRGIFATEAWVAFEEGIMGMREKILREVHCEEG